jgi:hypothetical protein
MEMIIKLVIWAVAAFFLSNLLHRLFTPSEVWLAVLLTAIPIVLLGLHYNYRTSGSSFSLFGVSIWSRSTSYRRLTLWGIPIGSEQHLHTEVAWLRDVKANQLIYSAVKFFPSTLAILPKTIAGVLSAGRR